MMRLPMLSPVTLATPVNRWDVLPVAVSRARARGMGGLRPIDLCPFRLRATQSSGK